MPGEVTGGGQPERALATAGASTGGGQVVRVVATGYHKCGAISSGGGRAHQALPPRLLDLQELEHLRLLDETKPADIGRPPWDAVLKSFLHGIKYESALSALDPKEEGSQHKDSAVEASKNLERCFKSLTDVIGTITFSQNDCCENIGSDNSAQRTSQSFDQHEKHVDSEALGLLSWMASSQAGEEPTTDDELVELIEA
ncbi:uncharacterized protein LOC125524585 isoform X2 [Triticum urartu]|uniref:uncharacterized protein LOC125524585 isoform X2 n=1 Tax=Triticum urartu TaxID=4572 RepID=UPI0020434AEF|nr:uncharacterized protein LOC125524585 isoform X2 [Triticum urartu]